MERSKTDTHFSACSTYEPLLEDYLSSSLSNDASQNVEGHLASCRGCSAALEDARAGARLLGFSGALSQDVAAPAPAFARRVMARIHEYQAAHEASSFWHPFVGLAWKFAATAALALLIMVTYAASNSGRNQAQVAPAAQAENYDLFSPNPVRSPDTRAEVISMMVEPNYANR